MTADIRIPAILKIGGGAFDEAAGILPGLKCRQAFIVTDAFLAGSGLAGRLKDQIVASGIDCKIFAGSVADPTTEAVHQGVRAFVEGKYDSLVSLGGGSSIDTAKAIGLLVANGGRISDYKVPKPIPVPGPPHVAIPTTAGTGSEVSRFTVISDSATEEKMLVAGGALVPSAAIVDYELTMSMPRRLTADTGTDSLTHAIEAYVSRKANAFTNLMALSANEDHLGGAAARLPPTRQSQRARSDDAGGHYGGNGVFQRQRRFSAWHEPADWILLPCPARAFECHVAARSDPVLGEGRPYTICRLRARYGNCKLEGLRGYGSEQADRRIVSQE
jgi:hypothetical protein